MAVAFGCITTRATDVEQPSIRAANAKQIDALIQNLGDPSYEKRIQATRELCVKGPQATERLRAAANDPNNPEVSLRARKLLEMFDSLLFAGLDVTLEFSKSTFAWDESVDLRVVFKNSSPYPARIPFEIPPNTNRNADARQVADMLDISDWLHVRGPRGREIELRVDEISEDADVMEVVQSRLGGGPTSALAPGDQAVIAARAFNRGWARYPMLDRADYTVEFEYVPHWQDPILSAAKIGRVASKPVTIAIAADAPNTISREGAVAELVLDNIGQDMEARLVNRTDRSIWINKNLGPSPPFAEGRWLLGVRGAHQELPAGWKSVPTWSDFDAAKLLELRAGESISVVRIPREELRRTLGPNTSALGPGDVTVAMTYANLCDRQWQNRQSASFKSDEKVPGVLREPLPQHMLSTRQTSNRIVLTPGE